MSADEQDDTPIEVEKEIAAPVEADEPAESLDDIIEAALDGAEDADAEAPAGDRGRDEKGRFKTKESAAEEGGKEPAADPAQPVSTEPAEKAQAAPPPVTDGHFRGWSPEERAAFGTLPPAAQKLVLDRQAATEAFYQRKVQDLSQQASSAEPVLKAYEQHRDMFAAQGMRPDQVMQGYANIERTLTYGTYADKQNLLQQIATTYGVALAPAQADPFADPSQPGAEGYARLHDIQSHNRRLEHEMAALKQQLNQSADAQLQNTIVSFSSEKDGQGNPKHPYFDVVRGTMAQMLSQGQAKTLPEAYALAVKPIESRISQEISARTGAAAQQQRAAVEKAKKAAPVRRSGNIPGGSTKAGSLDAIISGALDNGGM